MFKLQGAEFGSGVNQVLADISLKLVRTYKGEINRTQTGEIATFPNSFVTVGFDLRFVGTRATLREIERIFLSSDVVEIEFDFGGTALKGKFSCTSNTMNEMHAKADGTLELLISVVSDGTEITKPDGSGFNVTVDMGVSVYATEAEEKCYYGRVYKLKAAYAGYKDAFGCTQPDGKLLVLGDMQLYAP